MRSGFFIPGADSIPLDTSTPHGRAVRIAVATFSLVRPPARKTGFSSRGTRFQSKRWPLPPCSPLP